MMSVWRLVHLDVGSGVSLPMGMPVHVAGHRSPRAGRRQVHGISATAVGPGECEMQADRGIARGLNVLSQSSCVCR